MPMLTTTEQPQQASQANQANQREMPEPTAHVTVLPAETLDLLAPHAGGRYLDGTLGGAGHTALLLERSAPDGRVLGIDADAGALERARLRLPEAVTSGRLLLRQGNFADMQAIAGAADFAPLDGVLLDLGLSSDQLASHERGFSFASFASDAPLDMRFDTTQGQTAADLVNQLDETDLADILYRYGEERRSRAIARRIVERRRQAPIERSGELAALVASVVHGRLGGISFHSLEDRIVKQFFQAEERGCICPPEAPVCVCGRTPRMHILTRHPIVAGADELARNPRSRSAKLRVAERL